MDDKNENLKAQQQQYEGNWLIAQFSESCLCRIIFNKTDCEVKQRSRFSRLEESAGNEELSV